MVTSWYNYTYGYPDGYIKDAIELTDIVFYVGKGTKSRINAHEREALTGCECDKCQVIREIWKNGYPVKKRLVFETLIEEEAFKNEKDLILKHSGKYLTNITYNNPLPTPVQKQPSLTESLSEKEAEVFRLLWAGQDSYEVSDIEHISARTYSLVMKGQYYNAVILPTSFDFYEKRYHIAKHVPNLVICFTNNTVLPVPVLSVKDGNYTESCKMPEEIENLEEQRHSKTGSQVLLGMYLCGIQEAQDIIHDKDFPKSTRNRYLQKARELGKRKRGRPVDTQQSQSKVN